MTYKEALAAARRINLAFGPTIVFREPSKKKSYQAIAGTAIDLPPGARLITSFGPISDHPSKGVRDYANDSQ